MSSLRFVFILLFFLPGICASSQNDNCDSSVLFVGEWKLDWRYEEDTICKVCGENLDRPSWKYKFFADGTFIREWWPNKDGYVHPAGGGTWSYKNGVLTREFHHDGGVKSTVLTLFHFWSRDIMYQNLVGPLTWYEIYQRISESPIFSNEPFVPL